MGMYGPNRVASVKYIPSKNDTDEGTISIRFDDGKVAQFDATYKEYIDFNQMIETLNK